MSDRRYPPYEPRDSRRQRPARMPRNPEEALPRRRRPPRPGDTPRPRPGERGAARQERRPRRPVGAAVRKKPKGPDKGTKDLLRFFKNRASVPTLLVRDDARFIVYVNQFREMFSWQMIVTLVIILLGGLGTLAVNAHLTSLSTQINMARNTLQDRHVEVFRLENSLNVQFSHEEIAEVAIERLGMFLPDATQIIEINVPRQGGATLNTVMREAPAENYFWDDFVTFITGVVNRIFGGDT